MRPQDYADTLPQRPNEEVLYVRLMGVIGGEFDSTCDCQDSGPLILEDHDYLPGVKEEDSPPITPEEDGVTESEDEPSEDEARVARPVMIALHSRGSEDQNQSKVRYDIDDDNEDQLGSDYYPSDESESDAEYEYDEDDVEDECDHYGNEEEDNESVEC